MPIARAQALLRDLAHVVAVDAQAALFQVVEAQQQVHQRALAGARAADHADAFAGADDEIQVVEHLLAVVAAVGEGEVLDADLAAR